MSETESRERADYDEAKVAEMVVDLWNILRYQATSRGGKMARGKAESYLAGVIQVSVQATRERIAKGIREELKPNEITTPMLSALAEAIEKNEL